MEDVGRKNRTKTSRKAGCDLQSSRVFPDQQNYSRGGGARRYATCVKGRVLLLKSSREKESESVISTVSGSIKEFRS